MSYWQAQMLQDQERQSVPPVRWICPYCGHEVADERTPCCGEVHAMPMTDEEIAADNATFENMRREYVLEKTGMEPNPNGHKYGCECDDCMWFYRSLK